MRVVTNEATIQRNRRLAQMSFFFSLIALLAAFLFGNSLASQDNTVAIYFNCGVLPTLFLIILFSVRMANNWVREPLAWETLDESIRGLSSKAVIYHFIFPARHVLISPMGIYVFFPMFQERLIHIKDDKWRMPGGIVGAILTFMRQEAPGNPVREAQFEADVLKKALNRKFPDSLIEVQPVIVFINPRAKAQIEGESSIPITFATAGKEPNLKAYLKAQREADITTLSPEQIRHLDDELIYLPTEDDVEEPVVEEEEFEEEEEV